MEPSALVSMIIVLAVVWGIAVGYVNSLFFSEGLLSLHDWKGLLTPLERTLTLILAPLTLLVYFTCWILSGMRFGAWLDGKLWARYNRRHRRDQPCESMCY